MTRLLIIDDSPEDRDWLADMARQTGSFETRTEDLGAEGLARFAEDGADCIRLDHRAEVTVLDMPKILGHTPHLIQLFQCLIKNGVVHNTARRPQVTVGAEADGVSLIRVTVTDNGTCLTDISSKSLFDTKVTAPTPTGSTGLGLGLTMSRSIAKRHGGDLGCDWTEDNGAVFSILLPAMGA